MFGTLVGFISIFPTKTIEVSYFKVPENIEFCESVYFYDLELFEENKCDLELVEKRINDIKNHND